MKTQVQVVLTSSQARKRPVRVQILGDLLPETPEGPGGGHLSHTHRTHRDTHSQLLTLVALTTTLAECSDLGTGRSWGQDGGLRDAAGEVDPGQVWGGGDGVPEDGPVCRQEVDDVWRESTVPQDGVDGVAGGHGSVAGLPEDHVALDTQLYYHSLCDRDTSCWRLRPTIRAGVPARFPPMAVKLKGDTAATKP